MEPEDVTVIFGGNFLGRARTYTGEFDYSTDQIAFETEPGLARYRATGRFALDDQTAPATDYVITIFNNAVPAGGGARRDAILIEGDFTYADGVSGDVRIELASADLSTFPDRGLPGALELADFALLNSAEVTSGPATLGNRLAALTVREGLRDELERLTIEEARTVARLYEAGLDRDGTIDTAGLNFWIDQRERGLTERELAQAFIDSDEFEASFGDPDTLTDREFVEVLYRNILDRAGEQAGVNFWEGRLDDPGIERKDLLLAFAESPENVAGTGYIATLFETDPGFWDFV